MANPYRDELGRFASGSGDSSGGGFPKEWPHARADEIFDDDDSPKAYISSYGFGGADLSALGLNNGVLDLDAPEANVKISDLIATQKLVDKDTVRDYVQGKGGRGDKKDIWVVEHNGRLFLQDGHHRVAAEYAKGNNAVRVKIMKGAMPKAQLSEALETVKFVRRQWRK